MTTTNKARATVTSSRTGLAIECLTSEIPAVRSAITAYEAELDRLSALQLTATEHFSASGDAWDRTIGAVL